jgi:methylenetetrahydrofolate reductase (NADPH)
MLMFVRIDDLIKEKKSAGSFVRSVEFFPPKNEKTSEQFHQAAERLGSFQPDFVSITYGAGGSTRSRSLQYSVELQKNYDFNVMPHLTCTNTSVEELHETLEQFAADGHENIMALRGDPPKGETEFVQHERGFRYASDLVAYCREHFPRFCLGVGGYPEKHPEAESLEADLDALKTKVDAGASFITTQLFLDNADYWRYLELLDQNGIHVPVIPGILPPLSLKQLKRFCDLCKSRIPAELESRLSDVAEDAEASRKVGVEWAFAQIQELIDGGAPGFHLYILNRFESAMDLLELMREDKLPV